MWRNEKDQLTCSKKNCDLEIYLFHLWSFFTWNHEQFQLQILSRHYFPPVLTWYIYFLKLPLSVLSLFQTAVIMLFFLVLFLCLSASSPLFFQLSFCSSGFKPLPNSGIYFLSGTLCPQQNSMLITHTFTFSRGLWAFCLSHRDTLKSSLWNCYHPLQLCSSSGLLCIF